jgi:hypothetical protein
MEDVQELTARLDALVRRFDRLQEDMNVLERSLAVVKDVVERSLHREIKRGRK